MNISHITAPPPDNVHLDDVDLHRLNFRWDPVPSDCPSIDYKITATNCGVCPSATVNAAVTCVINDLIEVNRINNSCTLSVQSVVCGGIVGDSSNTVTAILRGIMKRYCTCISPIVELL